MTTALVFNSRMSTESLRSLCACKPQQTLLRAEATWAQGSTAMAYLLASSQEESLADRRLQFSSKFEAIINGFKSSSQEMTSVGKPAQFHSTLKAIQSTLVHKEETKSCWWYFCAAINLSDRKESWKVSLIPWVEIKMLQSLTEVVEVSFSFPLNWKENCITTAK